MSWFTLYVRGIRSTFIRTMHLNVKNEIDNLHDLQTNSHYVCDVLT